jgi:GT2 family glycosyltransferase
MSISVVIVAYGPEQYLERCLRCLEGRFPVLIVDNGSSERCRALAVQYGARYVDPGRNLGFAAGANLGIRRLEDESCDVLLLNPDAEIKPMDIEEMAKCLKGREAIACVSPLVVDAKTGAASRVLWPFPSPYREWIEAFGVYRWLTPPGEFVVGTALMCSRKAFEDVGEFDERFFLYAEETDWQRRAKERGWRSTVCEGAVALHIGAASEGDPSLTALRFDAAKEVYLRKWFGTAGWQVARVGIIVGCLIRLTVGNATVRRAALGRLKRYWRGPFAMAMEAGALPRVREAPTDVARPDIGSEPGM